MCARHENPTMLFFPKKTVFRIDPRFDIPAGDMICVRVPPCTSVRILTPLSHSDNGKKIQCRRMPVLHTLSMIASFPLPLDTHQSTYKNILEILC